MEKQLKVLIELLDGLEEEQENYETDEGENNFRDDIFLQIVKRGFMHSDGKVDLELIGILIDIPSLGGFPYY